MFSRPFLDCAKALTLNEILETLKTHTHNAAL